MFLFISILGEGDVTFDIIFDVCIPEENNMLKMIINIEGIMISYDRTVDVSEAGILNNEKAFVFMEFSIVFYR